MQLTKNFTLAEFTNSDLAVRYSLDNVPGAVALSNIEMLTESLLQPMREGLGALYISSGFRSEAVNQKAGGSKNSQHCLGRAADIKSIVGYSSLGVCQWVLDSGLEFDQLINEFSFWSHISYNKDNNRREVWTAVKVLNRKTDKWETKYIEGLANDGN